MGCTPQIEVGLTRVSFGQIMSPQVPKGSDGEEYAGGSRQGGRGMTENPTRRKPVEVPSRAARGNSLALRQAQ
jgi:hypothetical protein